MYLKPTMQIVKLQKRAQLLAGSNEEAGVQNYNWNEYQED